jgi:hypothetical protein
MKNQKEISIADLVVDDRDRHRVICQQPLPEITCCYLRKAMDEKWFAFYKGEEKIKDVLAKSYLDAVDEFMKWYQNYTPIK